MKNNIKKGKCFSAVNRGQRKASDFYQTPGTITRHLLNIEPFHGSILEPAAGDGAIVRELSKKYSNIHANDIRDNNELDFLHFPEDIKFANIIMNPPFSLAFEFIEKAKKYMRVKSRPFCLCPTYMVKNVLRLGYLRI